MTPAARAVTAPARVALTLITSSLVTLLLPAVLNAASTHALLVAALAAVALAGWRLHRSVTAGVAALVTPPSRATDQLCVLRTDRATDPLHSPLRPRAPGLA